jgi:putative ABC transport system permease protein
LPAIRSAVRRVDPGIPLYDIESLQDRMADSLIHQRINATVLGLFIVPAVVLVVSAIRGVVGRAIFDHRIEIAIRAAIGATPRQVLWGIGYKYAKVLAIGSALGLAVVVALATYGAERLVGFTFIEPGLVLVCVGVVQLIGAVSCLSALSAATRLDLASLLKSP